MQNYIGESSSSLILSGYQNIDSMLGGFRRGELIIVGSRPSMGKTSLAMNICENIALGQTEFGKKVSEPKPVLIFSFEMGREHFAKRMLFCNAKVPMTSFWDGNASSEQIDDLKKAGARLGAAPIYIYDQEGCQCENVAISDVFQEMGVNSILNADYSEDLCEQLRNAKICKDNFNGWSFSKICERIRLFNENGC